VFVQLLFGELRVVSRLGAKLEHQGETIN